MPTKLPALALVLLLATALGTTLAAQSPAALPTPRHSHTASGILITISPTEIHLRVAAASTAPVVAPQVGRSQVTKTQVANVPLPPVQEQAKELVFRIDKDTNLPSTAKPGDTVTITYYEEADFKIAHVVELPARGALPILATHKVEVGGTASNEPPGILFNTGTGFTRIKTVAVLDFDLIGGESGQSASLFASKNPSELLSARLVSDGTFRVTSADQLRAALKEQNFSNSDRNDPVTIAKLGKLFGIDAVILGNMTPTFSSQVSTSNGIIKTAKTHTELVHVDLSARLIDVQSGEVLAATNALGSAQEPLSGRVTKLFSFELGKQPAGTVDPTLITNAEADAVNKLAAALGSIPTAPLRGTIAVVTGDQVVISLGLNAGLHLGDHFTVTRAARAITDPTTGSVLHLIKSSVGQLTITKVDATSAEGTFKGSSSALPGDAVELTRDPASPASQKP